MKTTLGIEFEPFFPQISHRAKIGCAKYDLSTGEGVAMEQWYLNMGEVPGTPLSQIVGIYSNVKPEDRECLKTSLSRLVHGETDHDQREARVKDGGMEMDSSGYNGGGSGEIKPHPITDEL